MWIIKFSGALTKCTIPKQCSRYSKTTEIEFVFSATLPFETPMCSCPKNHSDEIPLQKHCIFLCNYFARLPFFKFNDWFRTLKLWPHFMWQVILVSHFWWLNYHLVQNKSQLDIRVALLLFIYLFYFVLLALFALFCGFIVAAKYVWTEIMAKRKKRTK